tara:strand:+ start:281 stop:1222 length:942 start_codon:yes stop_codon:yes gene_type:complete
MSNAVVGIVVPIFGVIIVGYTAGRFRLLDRNAIHGLSLYVFNLAIPILLFRVLATTELPEALPWRYLVGYYACALTFFWVSLRLARFLFGYGRGEAGVFAFGCSYGSFIPLGIPLVLATFGQQAAVPLFILVATQAPVMFPMMTAVQESVDVADKSGLSRLWAMLKGIAANQYLAGIALGVLVNLMGIPLPLPVLDVLQFISQSAAPCALFALGAALSQYRIAGAISASITISILKTLVFPAVVWLVTDRLLDLDPLWQAVLVLLAALPVGINTYLFAEQYRTAVPLAAASTVLSTGLSMITISIILGLIELP